MPLISLAREPSRYQSVSRALQLIQSDIATSLAKPRCILIKPNFVFDSKQLCATHVDTTRAIIDCLQAYNPKEVIIAESSAQSATRAFTNYHYHQLVKEYGIELVDLDDDAYDEVSIFTRLKEGQFGTTTVRVSKTVLDAEYRVSPAVMKTHDTVIVTLSVKNIVMGSVLDKTRMHQGYEAMNFNLYKIAKLVPVHLAVIDGWQAMEGNGPVRGSAVDAHTVLASTDFIAADIIGAELMGFNPENIGYLQYAAGCYGFDPLGVGDREKITLVGESPETLRRTFRPHDSYRDQLAWQIPETLIPTMNAILNVAGS
ncbi:MAG: DUF362 domain-containing protein [Candidatus Bathyarchaeota archaeon]|nr:DUF362 domain-containing protein [Candidatus Bathyarchaeota archaeon]